MNIDKGGNMSQGANANYSGTSFEEKVRAFLRNRGHTPKKHRYKALWFNPKPTGRLNETEIHIPELEMVIECKNQNGSGTADQKIITELYNAHKRIDCKHYVLLYGGSWWSDGRGQSLILAGKEFIQDVDKYMPTQSSKKLHVMKYEEFCTWFDNNFSSRSQA
tara:strand:- start:477 stop:965 length:489 start_codon:yes stop_codon:yes gene_type:complete